MQSVQWPLFSTCAVPGTRNRFKNGSKLKRKCTGCLCIYICIFRSRSICGFFSSLSEIPFHLPSSIDFNATSFLNNKFLLQFNVVWLPFDCVSTQWGPQAAYVVVVGSRWEFKCRNCNGKNKYIYNHQHTTTNFGAQIFLYEILKKKSVKTGFEAISVSQLKNSCEKNSNECVLNSGKMGGSIACYLLLLMILNFPPSFKWLSTHVVGCMSCSPAQTHTMFISNGNNNMPDVGLLKKRQTLVRRSKHE